MVRNQQQVKLSTVQVDLLIKPGVFRTLLIRKILLVHTSQIPSIQIFYKCYTYKLFHCQVQE